ncbi:Imm31 family immunity protein [Nonomuraea terrae]|nr:Imm31 family immunity protein [Nonomuraea terrae]
MSEIDFYEIVRVLNTDDSAALGVGNTHGVVVGISEEAGERKYAVLIGGTTYILGPSDLAQTGKKVDRETIYGGDIAHVLPERYSDDEP